MTFRLDVRYLLPLGALGIIVLVIVFVQLCGSDDSPEVPSSVAVQDETATVGPTFTPGPSPLPGAATATVEATVAPEATLPPGAPGTADERDAVRQQDLAAIQAALAQFKDEHDEYPDNKGGIQSLCVYQDADLGCELQEFLNPIPQDPLGDGAKNGYFYSSDGSQYTVYALREGDQLTECPDHPQHLSDLDSVYCVKSP